ncbi:DUF835 domain-containing protein [Thermococcus sp. GR6]|nr:DUF835 domain-containing protein [Thermococcus sp. GR6]NJE42437.1 DUF835 domain-containing protein [Thermococcus sp. GR6]
MIWGDIIPHVNFLSRWLLFFAVAYKTYQTKEKGWALLSAAFFINALDVESYIFDPLGIELSSEAYRIVSEIPNFFIATLLIWGAIHLKYEVSKLKHIVYLSVFLVASYVWLLLLATNVFGDNFILSSLFPSFAYGGALIYFGLVLKRHKISGHGIDALFPWGLILLGALNLTYPFTRNLDQFVPVGFSLGALFRLIAAVGAIKFVFNPFPHIEVSGKQDIPSGAFLYYTKDDVSGKFGKWESKSGLVMITREDINRLKQWINPKATVFWITRAKEGRLHDSPAIYAISPTKIDILMDFIAKALQGGYSIVYIDAIEYLILENGFENVFKFLLNIKDRVLTRGGTMILVVDPNALETFHRKMLEREFSGD